jgi:hypothetical protein
MKLHGRKIAALSPDRQAAPRREGSASWRIGGGHWRIRQFATPIGAQTSGIGVVGQWHAT